MSVTRRGAEAALGVAGTTIVPHFDAAENTFTVEEVQDVEAIIENNKRLQGEAQKSDMMRHVASIPAIFLTQWLHEEWNRGNRIKAFGKEMDKVVARKLRDPDYRFLRTDAPGTKWR